MRFAVVGDSFAEGFGDERADGSVRGWSDLVAQGMANALGEPIDYTNFAVRGRLLRPIISDQLEAALALDPRPTLLAFNGGGNDMMRPGMDADTLVALIRQAIERCREHDVPVLLLAGADPTTRLPFGRVMQKRGDALTDSLHDFAVQNTFARVDIWHDTEIRAAKYWSPDRLHLNARGHHRVASIIVTTLGFDPANLPEVGDDIVSCEGQSQWEFYKEHFIPWVKRRIKGESSGDGRTGKYESWTRIEPVTAND